MSEEEDSGLDVADAGQGKVCTRNLPSSCSVACQYRREALVILTCARLSSRSSLAICPACTSPIGTEPS